MPLRTPGYAEVMVGDAAPILRVLGYVGIVVMGAVAGLLGSFQQSNELFVRGVGLPLGLLLGLALTVMVLITAGLGTRSRSGAGLALAGWVLAVVAMSSQRPEGDLVVAATPLGLVWLFGGTVAGGACLAWPYRRVRGPVTSARAADPVRLQDPGAPGATGSSEGEGRRSGR